MPFDQNDLIWSHSVQILPFVIWVVFDPERLSLAVRIYKSHREGVVLSYTPVIAQAQRPVDSRVGDRPPEVDNLETTFKELWDVGSWEMSMHTRDRGLVGLVDVHLGHRLAAIRTVVNLAWTTATNGWE
jgi:hypothetical protein